MRIISLLVAVFVLAVGVSGGAQEKLTLTTPVTQPSIADYTTVVLTIDRVSQTLTVVLRPSNTSLPNLSCTWGAMGTAKGGVSCTNGFSNGTGPANFATTMAWIRALNKADLTSNSLDKRIYQQLLDDGVFVGSVTGTPQ